MGSMGNNSYRNVSRYEGGVEDLEKRLELLEMLDVVVDEIRDREEMCEELFWRKDKILVHKLAHRDVYAQLLFAIDPLPVECPLPSSYDYDYDYIRLLEKALDLAYEMIKFPGLFRPER